MSNFQHFDGERLIDMADSGSNGDPALQVIAHKVSRLADDMRAVNSTMTKMADNMIILARIEERQANTIDKLELLSASNADKESRIRALESAVPPALDKRMAVIEQVIPSLIEMRYWVIGGVSTGAVAILAAVINWVKVS